MSKIENLTKKDVSDFFYTAANESFFIFINKIYPQIYVAAMGSFYAYT